MHPPSQLFIDLPERCPHPIAPCDPLYKELPMSVAFTDEGKAEKVEGLRFAKPTLSASIRRSAQFTLPRLSQMNLRPGFYDQQSSER
jgi:hypothetical protein